MGAEPYVRLGLLSLTQNGFVRVMSQSGYPNSVATPEAIRILGMATRQQEHAFWPDDSSMTDSDRFRSERILGPKQVTDLYLLSLAVQRDARLATFDRTIPLSAVVGAGSKHLTGRAVVGMARRPEPTLSSDPPPIHAPMPFIAVDAEMLPGSPKSVFPSRVLRRRESRESNGRSAEPPTGPVILHPHGG